MGRLGEAGQSGQLSHRKDAAPRVMALATVKERRPLPRLQLYLGAQSRA